VIPYLIAIDLMQCNSNRFLVSHPGKQHVKNVLEVVSQKFCLERFYTLLSLDRIPGGHRFFPNKCYRSLPAGSTTQYPILALKHYAFRQDLYLDTYREYDRLVATEVNVIKPELMIGYENANLRSFAAVKAQSGATILDLAAVHHSEYEKLWNDFPLFKSGFKDRGYFDSMNSYKEEAYKYTDYCLCLSEYARDSLLQAGIKEDRIFLIPLGVDHSVFYPSEDDVKRPSNEMRLLYVGRIHPLKGLGELLSVMRRLEGKFDIRLDIVGPVMRGGCIPVPTGPNVRYHKPMKQQALRKMYQQADLFINFSYTDSWAQTVLEAMACSTAVIVTKNTGSKDAVMKGGGKVLDVANEDQLHDVIISFYEDSCMLEKLSSDAHEVSLEYTSDIYRTKLARVLNHIVSG
jgi:glycosyltransferase involved in cell wall biosynthesis